MLTKEVATINDDITMFPLMRDWKIVWATSGTYGEFEEGPVPHAFLVSRSNSLELLLRVNVSKQQMMKELHQLRKGIDEGLLDDLCCDLPPDPQGVEHFGY
jgi:hypothetical protein